MTAELPSFDRPPLTEVFLAAQFEPLAKLRTSHLGQFMGGLGAAWNSLPDAPALGQTHEPVGPEPEWLASAFEIELNRGTRLRSESADSSRMLQVENGWIALNWRGGGGSPYPRFGTLQREFEAQLARLEDLLSSNNIGTIGPNLWEVGYVNVFPRGDLWANASEIPSLIPTLLSPGPSGTGSLQTISGRWAYVISPGVGRIQIFAEHALRGLAEPTECLMLRLIARGPVAEPSMKTMMEGLSLGHETIVRTFAQLISDRAKTHLGYNP